jgi:hypothetical protein
MLSQAQMCHDPLCAGDLVQVILVAGSASDARVVAKAWAAGAPRCAVETVLIDPPPGVGAEPGGAPAPSGQPTGVFVPTTALGLTSVTPPSLPPEAARLRELAARADLVVVHTGVLDAGTLRSGPVAEATSAAAPYAVPVVVLAGRNEAVRREWSAGGVSGVHEVGDDVGETVPRVARTWAPSWASSSAPSSAPDGTVARARGRDA